MSGCSKWEFDLTGLADKQSKVSTTMTDYLLVYALNLLFYHFSFAPITPKLCPATHTVMMSVTGVK